MDGLSPKQRHVFKTEVLDVYAGEERCYQCANDLPWGERYMGGDGDLLCSQSRHIVNRDD
jgi:hypothetical protein